MILYVKGMGMVVRPHAQRRALEVTPTGIP
jgi:hypothetical protein